MVLGNVHVVKDVESGKILEGSLFLILKDGVIMQWWFPRVSPTEVKE